MYKTLLLCLCLMPVVAYAADDDKKDNDKKDNEKKTEQTKDKKKNCANQNFLHMTEQLLFIHIIVNE